MPLLVIKEGVINADVVDEEEYEKAKQEVTREIRQGLAHVKRLTQEADDEGDQIWSDTDSGEEYEERAVKLTGLMKSYTMPSEKGRERQYRVSTGSAVETPIGRYMS